MYSDWSSKPRGGLPKNGRCGIGHRMLKFFHTSTKLKTKDHMSRPRKPTNILALTGAFKRNPSRAVERANEPAPIGEIGDAPERLSEFERQCWVELVSSAHAGVLCAADRLFVEYGARVLAQLRNQTDIDPKLGIRFETVCARLGMTPADRSKVQIIKPKANENPFAKFKPAG